MSDNVPIPNQAAAAADSYTAAPTMVDMGTQTEFHDDVTDTSSEEEIEPITELLRGVKIAPAMKANDEPAGVLENLDYTDFATHLDFVAWADNGETATFQLGTYTDNQFVCKAATKIPLRLVTAVSKPLGVGLSSKGFFTESIDQTVRVDHISLRSFTRLINIIRAGGPVVTMRGGMTDGLDDLTGLMEAYVAADYWQMETVMPWIQDSVSRHLEWLQLTWSGEARAAYHPNADPADRTAYEAVSKARLRDFSKAAGIITRLLNNTSHPLTCAALADSLHRACPAVEVQDNLMMMNQGLVYWLAYWYMDARKVGRI